MPSSFRSNSQSGPVNRSCVRVAAIGTTQSGNDVMTEHHDLIFRQNTGNSRTTSTPDFATPGFISFARRCQDGHLMPKLHRSSDFSIGSVLVVCLLAVTRPSAVSAEVLFQNTGNKLGWGRVFTQKAGTIDEVASPVYKGTTAVKTTQTYQSSDGKNYHSEIIKERAHLAGQDLYYGHAVYLPADWVFHSQNVTFQQWAPEDPEAPWILMYLQGEKVRLGGRGAGGDKDAGSFSGLRGTWIRVVTRIHMANPGMFEV